MQKFAQRLKKGTQEQLREIMVYPTHKDAGFSINIKNADTDEVTITVVNAVGMKVYKNSNSIGTEYNKQIKLDNLAIGIYYVKVKLDSEVITTKLVIE